MGLKACKFRGELKDGLYPCACAAVIQSAVPPEGCADCPVPDRLDRGVVMRRKSDGGPVASISPPLSPEELAARQAAYGAPEAVAARAKAAEEQRVRELGPGTELKKLLAELGLTPKAGCQCNARAAQMNEWGSDGCRERRAEIVTWIMEEAGKASWGEWWRAAHAVAFKAWFRVGDNYGSIVDEAIRRAELALAGAEQPQDGGKKQDGHAQGK